MIYVRASGSEVKLAIDNCLVLQGPPELPEFPEHVPEVTPVSFRDIDLLPYMSMEHHCSDPCPSCGAFNMRVGDYVCFGVCSICVDPKNCAF